MDIKNLKFSFLKDEPITKDRPGFFRFYHENFSPALKEIIENDSCVHTIGLFGRWGTGKSTIIDLLKKDLKFKLFLFDAWKYQEDSLRRIFLIKLVEFLRLSGFTIDEHILDPLYKGSETTVEEKAVDSSKIGFFKKAWAVIKPYWLLMLIVAFAAGWVLVSLFAHNGFWAVIKNALGYLFSLTAVVTVLKPVFEKVLDESMKKIFSSVLPWSEVRARVEKEDRLNSPEQFEKLFNDILKSIDQKVIIVFDNIDRVQGDIAIKTLSTIKTFLDPVKKSNVTFVVPCDADAIEQQIRSFYGDGIAETENFDPSEYLRKLFNVVIYTPEFIDTDLEEYTKHQIEQTGEIKDLLLDEDVILVITKAFSNNPREIKQFINNLISAIVVVSKTEVADLILQKGKVAYLAKVLVLKQKFSPAYARLKDKWYEPDGILKESETDNEKGKNKEAELTNFLNGTSRITTDDAEPYIYFKRPAIAANIANAQTLRQYLLAGDEKQFEAAALVENNKGALVDYVLLLLKRYQNQHDPLLQIFATQLAVFGKNNFPVSKKSYFDESLKVLDVQLWPNYLTFSVDTIFSLLLNNTQADGRLKSKIVERYILALASDQLKQSEQKPFIISLLKNILAQPKLLSSGQKTKVAQALEQGYATRPDILGTFAKPDDQKLYITQKTLEQFIQSTDRKAAEANIPTFLAYQDYIEQRNLTSVMLGKIQEWISAETTQAADYRPQKEALMVAINKLLNIFHDKIKDLPTDIKQQFGQSFIQAFDSIGTWDNKSIFINSLRWIWPRLDDPQKNEFSTRMTQFFQQASAEKIKSVLGYWSKDFQSTFLGEHINSILPRLISDSGLLNVVYGFAKKEQKLQIIKYLIQNQPNHGIDFIRSLQDDLPDRQEIIRILLTKAESLAPAQCATIYAYANEKLSKQDENTIKDIAVAQIKKLLKTEDAAAQQIGYEFLTGGSFLSEERKREIGKEIVEHLRLPGRNLTEVYAFDFKTMVNLFDALQETPKNDFIYLAFDSIRPEKNKPALEVFTQALKIVSPQFAEFEKDYKDLYERLKNWPEGETKSFVISQIMELKPKTASKPEKEFWISIEKLIPQKQEQTT